MGLNLKFVWKVMIQLFQPMEMMLLETIPCRMMERNFSMIKKTNLLQRVNISNPTLRISHPGMDVAMRKICCPVKTSLKDGESRLQLLKLVGSIVSTSHRTEFSS